MMAGTKHFYSEVNLHTNFLTNAKGVRLTSLPNDIVSPVNGDIWYNNTLGKFRIKESGVVKNLIVAASFDTIEGDPLNCVPLSNLFDAKLDVSAYQNRFKGKYTSLLALTTALPLASVGDYAQVDLGAGSDVVNYNWDSQDGWVEGGSGSAATTTDELIEGSTNLYFTTARVLATVLIGLVNGSGIVLNTDTILIGIGKITNYLNTLNTTVSGHISNTSNPHSVTKSQVGLSNVPNFDTTSAVTNSHTHSNMILLNAITESFTTVLKTAYDGAVTWISTNGATLISHLSNTSNPHSVTASQVGLGNVNNTADVDKPISNATQGAIDTINNELTRKVPLGSEALPNDNELAIFAGAGLEACGYGLDPTRDSLVRLSDLSKFLFDLDLRGGAGSTQDRLNIINSMLSPIKFLSGIYYDNSVCAPATALVAGIANNIDISPYVAPYSFTINNIGVNVGTPVTGAFVKIVIYESDINGAPSNLLYESDQINVSSGSGYRAAASMTFNFVVGKMYYIGVRHSSTATIRHFFAAGTVSLGLIGGSTGTTYATIIRRSLAFATAAPNPFNMINAERIAANIPSIRFRIS